VSWKDDARKRQKEKAGGNQLKLAEGENSVRLMPDKKDILKGGKMQSDEDKQHSPYREFNLHYGVGATKEKPNGYTVACGLDMAGDGECWLCQEKIPELKKLPKKAATAERIKRKEAVLMQASLYDGDAETFSNPKPWNVSAGGPKSLASRLANKLLNSKRNLLDPTKGHNINITRTGDGMNTRYPDVDVDESPTPLPIEILKKVVDLDTLVPEYDAEDQKAVYFGRKRKNEDEDEDEDDEDEGGDEETGEEEEESGEDSEEETEDSEEETGEEEEESSEDSEESEEESSEEETEGEEESSEAEDEEESGEEETEDEEEPEPAPKKKSAKAKPGSKEKTGKPAPAPAKPPVKKKKK